MAVTDVKDGFIKRLFGTNASIKRDRYMSADPDNLIQEPQNLFGANEQLLGFLGAQPQLNPQAQPNVQQPQAQPPVTVGEMDQGTQSPQSRYQLFQMFQKPQRDIEAEDTIKRRAKINAIGKGISGLAGLAGMAVGGDAPAVPDFVTPFNMQQLQMLDSDYRNQLQNWINQGFQVDQANTGLRNKEIEEDTAAQNRMAQIEAQGQNQMAAVQARAQAALQQLQAKTRAEQIKEMKSMGINPSDPDAYGKYLNAMQQKAAADLGYLKSKTNWNNRIASGSRSSVRGSGGANTPQFDLETLRIGRDRKMKQIQDQRQQALAGASMADRAEINKRFDKLEDEVRTYRPGANQLTDQEMYYLGLQDDEMPFDDGGQVQQWEGNYMQGGGLQMPEPQTDVNAVIKEGVNTIIRPDFKFMDIEQRGQIIETLVQAMLESGKVETEEEAEEWIRRIIDGEDF